MVKEVVEPGSIVPTDEFVARGLLTPDCYTHGAAKHGERGWARYD
jgi:hypothetical protein